MPLLICNDIPNLLLKALIAGFRLAFTVYRNASFSSVCMSAKKLLLRDMSSTQCNIDGNAARVQYVCTFKSLLQHLAMIAGIMLEYFAAVYILCSL